MAMMIPLATTRTQSAVFGEYSDAEDKLNFNKTVVPVRLARVGSQNLVSRAQAKRLYAGFDKFNLVVLDFAEIDMIGQAFADELFRVFPATHPQVQLVHLNATDDVTKMINRVLDSFPRANG